MSAAQTLTFTLRGADSDTLSPALRKACDRCRRRKTRCDGLPECGNCFKAGATCSYLTIPKRKGPKPRAQRLSESTLQRGRLSSQNSQRPSIPRSISVQDYQLQSLEENLVEQNELGDIHFEDFSFEDNSSILSNDSIRGRARKHSTTPSTSDWSQASYDAFQNSTSIDGSDAGCFVPCITEEPSNVVQTTLPARHESEHSPGLPPKSDTIMTKCSETCNVMLPFSVFVPYLHLFFTRLYPIFPVLDRTAFLNHIADANRNERQIQVHEYALLSSLSAAVIVQLNLLDRDCLLSALATTTDAGEPLFQDSDLNYFPADFFVSQCLESRQQWDFMETVDEHTIMTSFFLFEYFGNRNQSQRAWYYLREAIGFALSLGLDETESYYQFTGEAAQRRCRLFWLLFVTERAYALQHRSGVMLRASIDLPKIFESSEPKLIYGFVNLVSLFKSVDDSFVSAWKGRRSSDPGSITTSQSLHRAHTSLLEQQGLGGTSDPLVLEIDETQRIDFMVTQQWLYLLSWQLKNRRNSTSSMITVDTSAERPEMPCTNPMYPFKVSKDLLGIIAGANRQALESHGIGMEQKIFDVACCLSDVIGSPNGLRTEIFSMGHKFLHGFMQLLAVFRNQESRYLQPLLSKAASTLAAGMQVPQLLPPTEEPDEILEDWENCARWDSTHIIQ